MKIGDKVFLTDKHPHGEAIGIYTCNKKTILGFRPIVRLESGKEVFIMKSEQWRDLK